MSQKGLTFEEDADLRRLHLMQQFGSVSDRFAERYTELRNRDRRDDVREPEDLLAPAPVPVETDEA